MNCRKTLVAIVSVIFALGGCTSPPEPPQQSNQNATPFGVDKQAQSVPVVRVIAQDIRSEAKLPADLLAYRDVAIYSKIPAYVDWLNVDRGSIVKHGEIIVRLTAPELKAQRNQATEEAKAAHRDMEQAQADLKSLTQEQREAEATLKAEEDTYQRLKGAANYPGIISGNDLEIAQKRAEADQAKVRSLIEKREAVAKRISALKDKEQAARSSAQSSKDIEAYLRITAPFDGVITERNVHEGSFVSPPAAATNNTKPMLRVQQLSVLRLVVPVPEMAVGGIVSGATVKFSVPAFTGESFNGVVKRIGHYLDLATRTMPVELDVSNPDRKLAPGMYAEVLWPMRRAHPSLLVPQTAVAKTTERMFVVKIKDDVVDWVDVKTGVPVDDKVEVVGNLQEGDLVAVRGTDELREGMHVEPKLDTSGK